MVDAGVTEDLGRALGDTRRRLRPDEACAVRLNLTRLGLAGASAAETEARVRDTFHAFGLFLCEFARGLALTPAQIARRWEIEGWSHLADLARSPRGFILAGAHTGNWEHLGALAPLVGRRIVVPTDTQFHPWISPAIARWKCRRGVESIRPARGLRPLLRALERGDLVGIPLDGGTYRAGMRLELCGRPVDLAAGAAQLASLSGCPILPVFGRRTRFMRQQVKILAPIWPDDRGASRAPLSPDEHAASRAVAVRACAQRLADLLGDQLRRAPGQWCIFRSLAWHE